MYRTLLGANPKLRRDPQTAFQAVDDMINQLKGVDQSDKNLLLQQNAIMRQQLQLTIDAANNANRVQTTAMRDETSTANTAARDATQVQTTGMRDTTQRADTAARDATQVQTTGMRDETSTANTATREAGADRRSVGGHGIPKPLKAQLAATKQAIAAERRQITDQITQWKSSHRGATAKTDKVLAALQEKLDEVDQGASTTAQAGVKAAGGPGDQTSGY